MLDVLDSLSLSTPPSSCYNDIHYLIRLSVYCHIGKRYLWCRCGHSKKQPWCDGRHKGTGFTPIKFTVEVEDPESYLCGCKQTGMQPYCDGTHASPMVQNSQP